MGSLCTEETPLPSAAPHWLTHRNPPIILRIVHVEDAALWP